MYFFFFKQKTAYEMRISDWSSDVCSSDLAMAALMVTKPEAIDTVVATNLHADILSDLASALTGSLGNGATANINPAGDTPSMFEPIHGSAFDIVGKGIANPLGAFWTGAMMPIGRAHV